MNVAQNSMLTLFIALSILKSNQNIFQNLTYRKKSTTKVVKAKKLFHKLSLTYAYSFITSSSPLTTSSCWSQSDDVSSLEKSSSSSRSYVPSNMSVFNA